MRKMILFLFPVSLLLFCALTWNTPEDSCGEFKLVCREGPPWLQIMTGRAQLYLNDVLYVGVPLPVSIECH